MNKLNDFDNYRQEQIVKINALREGKKFSEFKVGDTVKVTYHVLPDDPIEPGEVVEWRSQSLSGICTSRRKNSFSSSFTISKIDNQKTSFQRIFMFYSPMIQSIEVIRKGRVRRAKLYYLSSLYGKAARIKERK